MNGIWGAVDVGNTSIHIGLFAADDTRPLPAPTIVYATASHEPNFSPLDDVLPSETIAWQIVSVNRPAQAALQAWVLTNRPGDTCRVLTHADLPLPIAVTAPEKVGMDRLAAAVGASAIRDAERPAIIIDAGSAITVDVVAANGSFIGGAIVPGMKMAARALAGQTDLLPEITVDVGEVPTAIGTDTLAAMRSGLYYSAVGGVRELIARFTAQLDGPAPQIIFAGGDAAKLAPQLDVASETIDHLVLGGVAIAVRTAKEAS
ncbi:type III pantothenate kinase [Blastopirellula retiformator]|uniref:Type III pantothenate kinase n=1 Tax=Blastopirellula retiformator TaxID=2527970 RepID=A0A5C5V4Y0_9BACT|nr:type III pantothenate kinase [Blastopirellula retiformator]TWT32785.1 Type III pantothenate kinase [Blastopirellula retiformator]